MPIDAPNSRFERFFPRYRKMVTDRLPSRVSKPSDVAALVYHAATDRKKLAIYTINNDLTQKLLPLLPPKVVDLFLMRQLRG